VRTQRAAIWILVGAAIGGCAVDQNKEVQQYRQVVDLKGATTQPATPSPWPAGKTLTLRDAMYLANQQTERLSIEGENYLQSLIGRQRAVALFLPSADLTGTSTLAESAGAANPTHTTDAFLSGRINLFNGFRDVAQLRAANLTIGQRRFLLLDLQESLLADVVRGYYQVLLSEAQIQVLQSSVGVQEARVRDVTQRQQAGLARTLDVAQTQAQLSATKVSLINAQNSLRNARQALVLLTNAQVADAPLVEIGVLPPQAGDLTDLQQRALQQRYDVLAARQARDAARQQVQASVGQYYPSAALNLNYFLYRESVPADRSWDSVLELNLPVFSAGKIEADVRNSWSQFRQASLTESLLRRQVLQSVDQAYTNYNDSIRRLAELEVQVTAARMATEQADASYQAGLATNLERITAQDQYLTAQIAQTNERYNQYVFATDLLRSVGGVRLWLDQPAAASTTAPAAATQPPATVAVPGDGK
jgi:outer membrane protein TolC